MRSWSSKNNSECAGFMCGVDGDGKILRRTEDDYMGGGRNSPGDYNSLLVLGESAMFLNLAQIEVVHLTRTFKSYELETT